MAWRAVKAVLTVVAVFFALLGVLIAGWAIFDGEYTGFFGVEQRMSIGSRVRLVAIGGLLWVPLVVMASRGRRGGKLEVEYRERSHRRQADRSRPSVASIEKRDPPEVRTCPGCNDRTLQCRAARPRAGDAGGDGGRPTSGGGFPILWCVCLGCSRLFESERDSTTYRQVSTEEYNRGLYG